MLSLAMHGTNIKLKLGVILWFTPANAFLFCFTLLSCESIFLCVLGYQMCIDMYHTHMELMQRLDQWNKHVCILNYFNIYISK
jgi:hypothetical protein